MDTCIKWTRTPKKYLKRSFLSLPTCIKWTLVIKFHHPTPDTGNVKDCLELPLKNVASYYLIIFSVQYCFLFRFVCIELVSLIWFLQFWVAIHVYGTMIKLVHFDKEISANVYRHSLWEYSKRFHCSFQWHLTPHMTLSIETCIRRTVPCIERTLQHSPRVSA